MKLRPNGIAHAKKKSLAMFGTGLMLMALMLIPLGGAQSSFATGNGAPSGAHYNLNINGVSNTANFPTADNSGGNVIFVPLNGHCDIGLTEGASFYVLDNNCMDGKANFQLPPPTTSTGSAQYTVWARAVGKPGGSSTLTTCATDPPTGEQLCSLNQVVTMRTHGKQTFTNVTNQLTQLCYLNTTTNQVTCANIFDPTFENYLWSYDNNGVKVLQLRFYPLS